MQSDHHIEIKETALWNENLCCSISCRIKFLDISVFSLRLLRLGNITRGITPVTLLLSNSLPPSDTSLSLVVAKSQQQIYPRDVEVAFTVAYVISILATLGGNTLMIYIVWKKPEVRTLTSFLFVNMAVSDIMVALFVMPVSMATPYTEGRWLAGALGKITCKLIYYVAFVSVTVSIFTLTIMAVDRFLAVKYPTKAFRTLRKAKVLIPFIWLTSLVLMWPWLVVMKLNQKSNFCDLKASQLGDMLVVIKALYAYTVAVLYILPLAVMSVLYGILIHHLWFHKTPGIRTNHVRRCEQTIKKRAVGLLVTILVAFTLCWLPAHVHHMFVVIDTRRAFSAEIPKYYMMAQNFVGHANSAINPWIIILLSRKFRQAFLQIAKILRAKFRSTTRETPVVLFSITRNSSNKITSASSTVVQFKVMKNSAATPHPGT